MRGEHISDALNMLPDEMLEETERIRGRRSRTNGFWRKGIAAAACFVLVVSGIWMFSQDFTRHDTGGLSQLTISREWRGGDFGMFECFMAYDISEQVNGNPWTKEAEISTLPVYHTPLDLEAYETKGDVYGGDISEMESILRDIADRLGLDGDTIEIGKRTGVYYLNAYLTAEKDGISIEVGHDLTAKIEFEPAVSIPEEYHFDYHSSYEELEAVAEYLKEEYNALIGMKQPRVNIDGGDYDYDGNQSYHLEFYDGSGDIKNQIINYNFNRVAFYSSENSLWLMRIFKPDLSNKIGEYPIITSDEAEECLLAGDYITSVPYEVPGREYVKKVELVYRAHEWEEYYMPYYKFYVELPEEEEYGIKTYGIGMKTYGIYYVPAVEKQYLSYQGEARFN